MYRTRLGPSGIACHGRYQCLQHHLRGGIGDLKGAPRQVGQQVIQITCANPRGPAPGTRRVPVVANPSARQAGEQSFKAAGTRVVERRVRTIIIRRERSCQVLQHAAVGGVRQAGSGV